MGDSGNFDANVGIRFSVKKNKKNTTEDIENYLSQKTLLITDTQEVPNVSVIEKLFDAGLKFDLNYRDWECWSSDYKEDLMEGYSEYYEKEFYSVSTKKTATVVDLELIDLELLNEFDISEVDVSLTHTVQMLSVSGYIYCENDNTEQDSCSTSSYAKLLSIPNADIVLMADGNGNC